LILSTQLQAQTISSTSDDSRSKSFISFTGGVAIPIGNFAASNTSGPISGSYATTSGFAKTGTHFAFEGAWYLSRFVGIGGSLSSSSFSVDTKSIAAGYVENYDCDSASSKARSYNTFNCYIGPYFSFPYKKITVDLRILGGISRTVTPDIFGTVINQYGGQNEGSTSTFVQTSGAAIAFGFQTGIGIRYNVYKHLILSLRSDYFYSKPNLTFENINRSNTGRILSSYNQPISGFNATFGIGYQF
jgi:hypothetical protein